MLALQAPAAPFRLALALPVRVTPAKLSSVLARLLAAVAVTSQLRLAQEMQAKMQNRLDTTTKRTIEENQQMNTELRYQARQTSALLDENDRLKRQAAAHANRAIAAATTDATRISTSQIADTLLRVGRQALAPPDRRLARPPPWSPSPAPLDHARMCQ